MRIYLRGISSLAPVTISHTIINYNFLPLVEYLSILGQLGITYQKTDIHREPNNDQLVHCDITDILDKTHLSLNLKMGLLACVNSITTINAYEMQHWEGVGTIDPILKLSKNHWYTDDLRRRKIQATNVSYWAIY